MCQIRRDYRADDQVEVSYVATGIEDKANLASFGSMTVEGSLLRSLLFQIKLESTRTQRGTVSSLSSYRNGSFGPITTSRAYSLPRLERNSPSQEARHTRGWNPVLAALCGHTTKSSQFRVSFPKNTDLESDPKTPCPEGKNKTLPSNSRSPHTIGGSALSILVNARRSILEDFPSILLLRLFGFHAQGVTVGTDLVLKSGHNADR